jgi:hypothetical protein
LVSSLPASTSPVLLRLVRMPPRCGCRPSGDEGEPVVQHDSMPEEQEEHADADMALSMALRCDGVLGRCAGRLEREVGVKRRRTRRRRRRKKKRRQRRRRRRPR